jgi:hypothetical protein
MVASRLPVRRRSASIAVRDTCGNALASSVTRAACTCHHQPGAAVRRDTHMDHAYQARRDRVGSRTVACQRWRCREEFDYGWVGGRHTCSRG